MKNTIKLIGIALVAIIIGFSFTACSGSGGGRSINSATELKEYLDKQPANSPDKPIKVAMKANEMMIGDIARAMSGAGKYVSLNLSGSPLTEIPNSAFKNLKTLAGITIGNGVTGIGASAFSGTGLTGITIPNSVTSIGEYAFSECANLTSVTIGSGSIGDYAFNECASLTSITLGNGVTSIGYAFYGTGLTSITIPASVTEINTSFRNLTAITVDANNANYSSEGGILYNKAKTEIIEALRGISGNVTIPNSVTSIGGSAFMDCTGLTGITIPSSVTSIGDWAFGLCTSLTSVTIPNSVTSIGDYAFYQCTSLASVTIPAGVTSIGSNAFEGCTSLASITIPYSVTSIGGAAFSGCTSLASITLSSSVTSIGGAAFYGCTNLTSITIPASVTYVGRRAFYSWTSSQTINIQGKANLAATIAAGWATERSGFSGNTYSTWDDDCNAQINYRR